MKNARYNPLASSKSPEFNCWSLARELRVKLFGLSELPLYGSIHSDNKRELTQAMMQVENDYFLHDCKPIEGCFATCWRVRLCVHIAIICEIDGKLYAVEIGEKCGIRKLPLDKFEAQYSKVRYHIDS